MATVVIKASLLDKMEALIKTLYENQYFSYYENAESYADSIRDFINTIPSKKLTKPVTPVTVHFIARINQTGVQHQYITHSILMVNMAGKKYFQ